MTSPKDRFILKALKLTFKVKKAIGCRWYKRYTDLQKKFLSDIAYFPEELIDFLQLDDFDSAEEYIKSINLWLELECRTFGYFYPLKYVIGKFYLTLEKINLHRDFIELRAKLNIVN